MNHKPSGFILYSAKKDKTMHNPGMLMGEEMKMMGYGQMPGAPSPINLPKDAQLHGYASATNEIDGKSFGETLSQMIGKANNLMGEPERLSVEAVTTGKVDIHEVMIALGKSEVAFKLMTSVNQKVIGAFDKLTSMQV